MRFLGQESLNGQLRVRALGLAWPPSASMVRVSATALALLRHFLLDEAYDRHHDRTAHATAGDLPDKASLLSVVRGYETPVAYMSVVDN